MMSQQRFASLFLCIVVCFLSSCSSNKPIVTSPSKTKESTLVHKKQIVTRNNLPLRPLDSIQYLIEHDIALAKHHVGFVLYDPETKDTVFQWNADKHFIPASNTKLFTYYAAKTLLGDQIPIINYKESGDSLIFQGAGDPLTLGYYDQNKVLISFLQSSSKSLYFDQSNFDDELLGAGWSWDDYPYYYQKEKNALPLFGNATQIRLHRDQDSIQVFPEMARSFITFDLTHKKVISRGFSSNAITINPSRVRRNHQLIEIPFHFDGEIQKQLLEKTLQKTINSATIKDRALTKTLYHNLGDSLYYELMMISDNFIAEQLLYGIANEYGETLNTKRAIQYIKDNVIQDCPDVVRWVDGSGLSRFNLFTPRSMVWILEKINDLITEDEIKRIFPHGNGEDTFHPIFKSPKDFPFSENNVENTKPFVYAKTGSLSNNHNISGYIFTISGKKLVFSFMNNNYMNTKSDIVNAMHTILSIVYYKW